MNLKLLVFILIINMQCDLNCQDISNFKEDIKSVLNNSINENEINYLMDKFSNLLIPQSGITQLNADIRGDELSQYPLSDFKNDSFYKDNIDILLNSENKYQRLVAYLIIGSSNDLSKENTLKERLLNEKEKGVLYWCFMAMLNLRTKYTTELFDFLVLNDDFGDSHMIPLYFELDKDSLRETAYKRYNSENIKAKVLAIQILSKTGKNPKTEQIVMDAVKNWDYQLKGYAIFTVKELHIGDLLISFKPLLENDLTRTIALEAMASSPSKEDKEYLLQLTDEKDSISNDLLGCFYESPNIDNLKIWLQLLVSKKIYNDYYFSVPNNPMIYSNELVPHIHKTLNGTKNENVISELLRALQGRFDETTTNLLIKYLKHKNSTIRYWSAITLEGNKSDKLKLLLPILAKDKNFRTSGIVKLLIENGINNLQSLFIKIYLKSKKDLGWERNSIEYLSSFPLKNHIKIFRKILVNKESDFSLKYNAAIGLGNLNDTNSVDLLINICETERKNSDYNVRIYLEVLGKLKGEKAKREIETFIASDEPIIRELSKSLIEDWYKK